MILLFKPKENLKWQ